ncbi:MAG: TIGR04013 family B12-binding domain/radical SAM domain-containing protein [Candidatus Lokiarchaeota archaeon]|nr:TIGR04013 family B12-binding domain/radical SAM domain-containing protein [Candidatus Lokiarchaeota archaeon]
MVDYIKYSLQDLILNFTNITGLDSLAESKTGFVVYYERNSLYSFNAIVAALETDEETRNIDIYYVKGSDTLLSSIKNALNQNGIVVVGFSIYSTQFWKYRKILRKIASKFKNQVYLIAGGPHPSGDPRGTLKLGFDYVFVGEAEKTITKFFSKLKHGEKPKNIPGIAYIDENERYQFKKNRDTIDLNDYPPFPLKNTQYGAIEISRGCPYKCYFCQASYTMGSIPRYRTVDEICKYIQILANENLVDIRFITPNAFSYGSKDGKSVNLKKLEELLSRVKQIIGKNGRIFYGSFPSEVRPEHVSREVLDLILTYADNDNIIIGGQSGSQRMLDICNRGHTVEDIYEAVKIAKDSGLNVNVDFIFGLPKENKQDRKETRKVMKDLIDMGAKIHAHTFIPLPKTPFSNAHPKKIDKHTKEFIKKNMADIYGNWKKHEKISFQIQKKLKK